MGNDDKKETRALISFTKEQREALTAAAEKLGMTFSTYVRMAALERMIRDGK